MPPWKPEPGFGSFHDERRLSEAEIQKIADWAEAGAPEGDRQGPAAAAQVSRRMAARHARPRAQSRRAVRRPGERARHLSLLRDPDPDRFEQDGRRRSSSGPGNRKVVHHALLYLDSTGAAREERRSRARPWLRQLRRPWHPADRRTRRLGARGHAPDAARRHGQVPPQGERPGPPDPLPPRRQARDRPVGRRHLFHQEAGPEDRRRDRRPDPKPRHPGRRDRYHVTAQSAPLPVDVAGDRHHAAHALHRQGNEGRRRDARRQDHPLDLDQGLGLQLAGPVSVQYARQARQGVGHQARRLLR